MATISDPRSFDASDLPSVKDGMSLVEEGLKRRKTCRFIEEAGRMLKLPRVATATAMVFFHRFYAKHSFNEHDRFEVSVACILLAAKTEEAPRKVLAVIDECYKLMSRAQAAGRMSQTSPNHPASTTTGSSLDPKGEEYLKLKERILLLERVVLHTIGFELSIDHPYKFLVDTIKKLIAKRSVEYITPNKPRDKMMHELVQYSMNFANDSMHTSLCLQFDAQYIATACVYLGGQFAKVVPAGSQTWLGVLEWNDVESLACKLKHSNCQPIWNDGTHSQNSSFIPSFLAISIQILELIQEKKGNNKEAFQAIHGDISKLRSAKASQGTESRNKSPIPPQGNKSPPPPCPPPKKQRTD